MKKKEFIQTSKRMVKEYYNRYIAATVFNELEIIPKITTANVYTVKFINKNKQFRILLRTYAPFDNNLYEIVYKKDTDEFYSTIYTENTTIIRLREE